MSGNRKNEKSQKMLKYCEEMMKNGGKQTKRTRKSREKKPTKDFGKSKEKTNRKFGKIAMSENRDKN